MITLIISTWLAYTIGLIVYRLYFDPLAKFPGPKLAAITRYYEGYYDTIKNGLYTRKIAELHEKYGPIVRISPYELHINEPSFYEQLYRQEGVWNKYAWSYDAFGVPGATFTTADHNVHKKRKAAVGSYFSRATIHSRQDLIKDHVGKLHDRLREHALKMPNDSIDIGSALSATAIDIATRYNLDYSGDNINRPDFNLSMVSVLKGSGAIWRWTKQVPFFGPLMHAIPQSIMEKAGDPRIVAFIAYQRQNEARVHELCAQAKTQDIKDSPPNLVHTILQSQLPDSERSPTRIYHDIDTITGAALETTAQTLRFIIYHLYTNGALLHRLRSELRTLSQTSSYSLIDLERLPYLTAVLKEGLRLTPGIATRMARIAPDRELVFDKWTIPAGTPVGMTTMLVHLNPEIYPEPKRFNPDRWMDVEEHKGDVSRVFAPFSRGTRMCLGLNLAWAELYFTLAMVVSTFDMEFDGTTAEDLEPYYDYFVPLPKGQRGVHVKLSLC